VRRAAQQIVRQQRSIGARIPAPVGGWDAQSPLSAMPADCAVVLDNWIPRAGYVEARRGFQSHVTGFSAPVQSLLVYRGAGPGADKLFAAAGTAIYDASTAGAVGAGVVTGLNSAQWQYVNFATNGATHLVCVSGADAPRRYDGTTWTTCGITGTSGAVTLDQTKLIDVTVMNSRIFLGEKNSLRVWFLASLAVDGAAGLLDLGSVADRGGTLQGIGTWSLEVAGGVTQFFVAVTDQGQAIIYQGSDPSDATKWALVAVLNVGKPLGRRCLLKYGAEMVLLTADGAIPLSQAMKIDRSQSENIAITAKLQQAWAQSARDYISNFGWEACLYPAGQLAIYNVPVTQLGTSYQYVQNVQTGSWCRFTGVNAFCWGIANDRPYFGAASSVCRWDVGGADNGMPITCDIRQAYTDLGASGRLKQFQMMRPLFRTPNTITASIDMAVDYADVLGATFPSTNVAATTFGVWDTTLWDVPLWYDDNTVIANWISTTGIGYVGAPRVRIVIQSALTNGAYPEVPVQLLSYDALYTVGGQV